MTRPAAAKGLYTALLVLAHQCSKHDYEPRPLCENWGWWGRRQQRLREGTPTVSRGGGYLKASFSFLRPRILSLGNTSFQQRTGMISHPGDQGLSQLAGLHMGSSSPRCSVGTHLLPPRTSCQCPAGSCFLGESPGMFPQTGPVVDFSGTPRGGLAWGIKPSGTLSNHRASCG